MQRPSRAGYALFAVLTIAAGLIVHFNGEALGSRRDVVGDALWAAMMVWWISALLPRSPTWARAAIAYGIAAAVELSQTIPALGPLRGTPLGHLVLGSDFDPRDFISYAAGVVAAGLIDVGRRRGFRARSARP